MANEEKGKGLFGALAGMVDSAKTAVHDIKLPDVKLPEVKMPDVKLPDIHLPNPFQGRGTNTEVPAAQNEITAISIQSALQIIYYMMNADGSISNDEEEKFDTIGRELDPLFSTVKAQIVSSCRHQMENLIDPEDRYEAVQDGVREAIITGTNTQEKAITPKLLVWDLLTLAYSDGGYDENERRLLKFIVRRLNVDKTVFLEMESSYLTLVDLENELKWIKATNRPFLTISAMMNEISTRKDAVFQSVKDLIAF